MSSSQGEKVLFAITIFLSALLLFLLEPLLGKRIVPWFGGSAAVWSTCLVFFQTALLLGYFYARSVTRLEHRTVQCALHVGVLTLSLGFLPIGPGQNWAMAGQAQDPSLAILGMLAVTAGIPFAALSATSPLLQYWLASDGWTMPYWLFAVSNFASLLGLLGYPLLIEPHFDTRNQRLWWSVLYGLFAALCAACAFHSRGRQARRMDAMKERAQAAKGVAGQRPWTWFGLAACGSMLLLSVTNHIDENVAAVPLLWVLPLAVYLITFVIAFAGTDFYRPTLFLRLLAFALGVLGYAIYNINAVDPIQITVPIFLGGLLIACLFCHGELNRLRPAPAGLADFYLIVAAGGSVGALFIGLLAPRIFNGIYELPLTLVIVALMALFVSWHAGWPPRILWTGVVICMCVVFTQNVKAYREGTLAMRRSFYGSLRVVQSRRAGPEQTRTLFHGTIEHGSEYLLPPRRSRPTTYYGPESGIGILLRECFSEPKRVGIVGLGTGTIAAYGHQGDVFRFYEINHQVVEIAESLFYFLRETAAKIEMAEGDARLSLERETSEGFDVLALDAFSGDAIPVHLLTEQAMGLYQRHLKPGGVIAVHVSNNYLDLEPVVGQLANAMGLKAIAMRSHGDDGESVLPADWVLVTNNKTVLDQETVKRFGHVIPPPTGLRPWTDTYNNLVQILKTPALK